jgi:dihydroanticapsin dehydrogenase
MRLEKTTALVTGASSGIGAAVSARFRREGARLLLTGRREHLDAAHPDDVYLPGDLNDEAFVADLAAQAAQSWPPRASARSTWSCSTTAYRPAAR